MSLGEPRAPLATAAAAAAARAPGAREAPRTPRSSRAQVRTGRARVLEGVNVKIEIGGDGGEQILKPELLPGPGARDMRRER